MLNNVRSTVLVLYSVHAILRTLKQHVLWEGLHEWSLLRLPQQHLCLYLVKAAELRVIAEPLVEQQLRHQVAHRREDHVSRVDGLAARVLEFFEQRSEAIPDGLLRCAALEPEILQSAQCESIHERV